MAQRSATSSTTQISPVARLGEVHISQISVVPILPQRKHSRAVTATACIISANGMSKSARLRMRCSTARRAERGPRPGSFAISSMSASISLVELLMRGFLWAEGWGLCPQTPRIFLERGSGVDLERQLHVFGQPEAFCDAGHFFLSLFTGLGLCVFDCGEDQIFDDFFFVRVED